jgi:hypothetical protein
MNKFQYRPRYNKYVVYCNNESGLGDRLFGILSTFLYAVVHNYHFRIKDFEPIPLQSFLYSKYPWADNLWTRQNLKRGVFNFNSYVQLEEELLTEGVIVDRYPESDCVMMYCNQNFIPYIFSNEAFQERLEELELTLENVYSELFDYLFVFREEYQSNYEYLIENILNKNGKTIGVHFRTNHFWGDVPYVDDSSFDKFVEAIESVIEPNDKIFLATDDKNYVDLLKEKFPQNKVHSLKGRVVHNTKTENQNVDDMVKAFYEIKLLSECDVRVLSYWSNFSRVAGVLGKDNNMIVDLFVDTTANWQTKYWWDNKEITDNNEIPKVYNVLNPINGFRFADTAELFLK